MFSVLCMKGKKDQSYVTWSGAASKYNNKREEYSILKTRASLVAQSVKNLPVVQETQVRSLGGEDPLEKEMAT